MNLPSGLVNADAVHEVGVLAAVLGLSSQPPLETVEGRGGHKLFDLFILTVLIELESDCSISAILAEDRLLVLD